MDAATGKCTGLVSYGNGLSPGKDGLVVCKITDDQPCVYNDFFNNTVKRDCQCSYDPSGNSYCRKIYADDNSDWKNYANNKRNKMSSTKCHTSHRFECSDYDVKGSYKQDFYNAILKTEKAHELQHADTCIQKLFASGEFLRYSFFMLIALIISLI